MNSNTIKKFKVELTDYDYRKDIENRMLLSRLTPPEVEVLTEIVYGSLKVPFSQFTQYIEQDEEAIRTTLEKLSKTGLLKLERNVLHVNKEKRKYFELHIQKFEPNFQPGLEFIQGLLNLIPIHVLPVWYPIPRMSDNIFESLVEKFFITPKTYERYLSELSFDNPVLNQIVESLYQSPALTLEIEKVREQFKLTEEEMEEAILLLEYNFAGYASRRETGGKWTEVITPFREWKSHCAFLKETEMLTPIPKDEVKGNHPNDFSFIQKLKEVLAHPENLQGADPEMLQAIESMNFGQLDSGSIKLHDFTADWLKKPLQEQAAMIYRMVTSQGTDRNIREVEKGLKRVLHSGWIFFEDFLKGLTTAVGSTEPVRLVKKGRKWAYRPPAYPEDDIEMIKMIITGPLYKAGITATGTYQGKLCFCVTPFGRMNLD